MYHLAFIWPSLIISWLLFLQDVYRNSMPASSFQQQKLRVCEVCSAYLGLHDNDRRLADHFGGKLHLGFIEIREKLEKLRVSRALEQAFTKVLQFINVIIACTSTDCILLNQLLMFFFPTESRCRKTRENATEKTRGA